MHGTDTDFAKVLDVHTRAVYSVLRAAANRLADGGRQKNGMSTMTSEPAQHSSAAGRLNGKVAVVTGASTGIGAATARMLAAQGAAVVLAARRADKLAELADEITGRAGEGAGRSGRDAVGPWPYVPGHGLWLARLLAGQMSVVSGPGGTCVAVLFALPAGAGLPGRAGQERCGAGRDRGGLPAAGEAGPSLVVNLQPSFVRAGRGLAGVPWAVPRAGLALAGGGE